ncbi:hypothetical protein WJX84_005819 [Apatococcus fuscideae]|uniref:Uncharacterized protein n=1 Tax=Apatococcus fuscideae TaxID=2026836 RepID=A0AAW1TA28_9CHLO
MRKGGSLTPNAFQRGPTSSAGSSSSPAVSIEIAKLDPNAFGLPDGSMTILGLAAVQPGSGRVLATGQGWLDKAQKSHAKDSTSFRWHAALAKDLGELQRTQAIICLQMLGWANSQPSRQALRLPLPLVIRVHPLVLPNDRVDARETLGPATSPERRQRRLPSLSCSAEHAAEIEQQGAGPSLHVSVPDTAPVEPQACQLPNEVYCTLPSAAQGCSVVAFSPDGACLAAACGMTDSFQVLVYDIATAVQLCAFGPHQGWIHDLDWMVEARLQQPRANVLVATGAYDGVIRLWSSTDGALLSFFQAEEGRIHRLSWLSAGMCLWAGTSSGVLIKLAIEDFTEASPALQEVGICRTVEGSPVVALTRLPGSARLVVRSHAGRLVEVEPVSLQIAADLGPLKSSRRLILQGHAVSADGRLLAAEPMAPVVVWSIAA